jgi:hypothetical protein
MRLYAQTCRMTRLGFTDPQDASVAWRNAVEQRVAQASPALSPLIVHSDKLPSIYGFTLHRGSHVNLQWLCGKAFS